MPEIKITLANGAEAGKTLQDITKQTTSAANALKKAEIGSKEYFEAQKRFKELKTIQEDLKKQTFGTAEASNTLKKSLGGVLNQIPGFGQLSGILSQAKGGVGGLTSGFGILKGAIVATGIGALVIAVTSLVGWFTKTEKGANIISGAFKGMGAVIDTLMNRLWNIGDTLKQLFSDPIQFFKNLGHDIADSAKEGYDLVQAYDALEDKQRELDVSAKKQENYIEKLLLNAKNVGKTYSEKIAILNEADRITRESYAEQLSLSNQHLELVKREVAAAEKSGVIGDDLADKLRDANLAVLELEGQKIQMEEKIQNRRDQIIVKQESNAAKEIQIEQVKVDTIDQIKTDATNKDETREDTTHQDKLKRAELELVTDQNILNEQYLAKQLTEEAFVTNSKDRLLAYHEQRLEILKTQFGVESEEYQKEYAKLLDLQIAAAEESNEVTKWLSSKGGKALTGSLSTFGNAFSQIAAMHAQGSESWKTFAIAAATISAIQGAINAYSSTAAIPIVGTTLAPIAAGVALAAGMAGVAKIKKTKQPSITGGVKKMRDGGILRGPSHAQGGIPIEAEGNEIILTQGVYNNQTLRRAASAINVAGGGRSFAAGGPVNPFDSRGPLSGNVDPFTQLRNDLRSYLESNEKRSEETSKRIDRIQVNNNLQETNKGLRVLDQLKSEADV